MKKVILGIALLSQFCFGVGGTPEFVQTSRSESESFVRVASFRSFPLYGSEEYSALIGTNDENTEKGTIWKFIRGLGSYNSETGKSALNTVLSSHEYLNVLINSDNLSWEKLKLLVDAERNEDRKAWAVYSALAKALIDQVDLLRVNTYRIDLSKDVSTDKVEVSYNWNSKKLLEIDQLVDFGVIGAGFLDGSNFFMSEGSLSSVAAFRSFPLYGSEEYSALIGANDENTEEGTIWKFIRGLGSYNPETGKNALNTVLLSREYLNILINSDNLSWEKLKSLVDVERNEDRKAWAVYSALAKELIDQVDLFQENTYRIDLSKDVSTDKEEVSYNWNSKKLFEVDQLVDFGAIGVGLWDGSDFLMSEGSLSSGVVKISSKGIPLIFDSFISSQCEVEAPFVGIFGDTKINNLSVKSNKTERSLAEIYENNDALLIVIGELTTKFLKAYGSTEIESEGTINLKENGELSLLGYGSNDYLGISGTLTSNGRLNIETSDNPFAKVINSGYITSDTGEISIKTNRFINNETGLMIGERASLQVDNLIENYGIIDLDEFNVTLPEGLMLTGGLGYNIIRFKQCGTFIIRNRAILACNVESLGSTGINHLVFSNVSDLKIVGGKTIIDRVSGRTSFIGAKDGAIVQIENLEDGADFVESRGSGSKLMISRFSSERKPVFSPKSGGKIMMGDVQVSESFMYSDDGSLDFSKLKGKTMALLQGTTELSMREATDFSLFAEDKTKTHVGQSVVRDAYLLGDEQNTFEETTVEFLNNRGKLKAIDTNIRSAENDNEISFTGNTLTNNLYNNGVVTFENGKHHVGSYTGKSSDAAVKVKSINQITDGESSDTVISVNKQDQVSDKTKKLLDFDKSVILQTGSSLVTIDNIAGTGDIEAFRQIYNKKLPTMFHTVGNVAAVLDYMPRSYEIPEHDAGDFLILANMHEDYINSDDVNYDDVLIFMQMNGYKWENRYAKFIAGGLKVNNASSWGNMEGFVGLKRLLSVEAGQIYNVSTPIARDNGRLVEDCSNWRARLVYYCPATYYSAKSNTGIAVIDRDINLKSQTSILNQFSNIYAGGNLNAKAGNVFDNKVGNIMALGAGQSSIDAPNINNECLPLYIRKGEAHAKGRCGWGTGRHTWYADSYTSEMITQSHGSKMIFGGDLDLKGHTENFGSKIMSKGLCRGDVNSKSLFENTAIHGSRGTAIEGDFLNYGAPLLFIHVDKELGM